MAQNPSIRNKNTLLKTTTKNGSHFLLPWKLICWDGKILDYPKNPDRSSVTPVQYSSDPEYLLRKAHKNTLSYTQKERHTHTTHKMGRSGKRRRLASGKAKETPAPAAPTPAGQEERPRKERYNVQANAKPNEAYATPQHITSHCSGS